MSQNNINKCFIVVAIMYMMLALGIGSFAIEATRTANLPSDYYIMWYAVLGLLSVAPLLLGVMTYVVYTWIKYGSSAEEKEKEQ